MDFHTLSSSKCVDKIKCTSCKNYLSYFPILLSQDQILCGRCPPNDITIRNVSFEALAQFIKFPCRYESQGCCEELLPEEIPHHEENCKYRVFPCPLTVPVACVWQGPRNILLDHCLKSHSDLVLENKEFDLDLTKSENVRNVLKHKGLPLFFDRKFDAEKKELKFAFYTYVYGPKIEYVPCYLKVSCGDKSLRVQFCSSDEEEYYLTELNLVSIIDSNDDKKLKGAKGRIIIEEPKEYRTVDIMMLSCLKCTYCSKYPPIFYSTDGVVCLKCRDKSGYNYHSTFPESLTKIVAMLNYPCKYFMNGCTYVAKPEEIVKHQSVCEMRDFPCPCAEYIISKGCTWNSTLKEIGDHLMQSNHKLVNNKTRISVILPEGHNWYTIIKFAKRFFRLSYSCIKSCECSEIYYFELQVIGPCSDDFEYEIEIFTHSTNKMKLAARAMCGQMTALSQLFKRSDYFCFFVKDQMTGCVVDNLLNFRVNIFK